MAQPSFDSILNAVMQAESGGRRYDSRGNLLTSDKGAKGEMQVLDTTKFSPGFGVEPAKANTPDERARVGRDYLRAMLDRYGDIDKALAAYNWGPGNTDKWIARGADPAKLPAETQGYISKIKSSLTGAPRTTAQAQATPEAAPAAAPARGAPAAAPVRVSEARPADLGPSYQAALALSFLSDEDEKESGRKEYDERQPSAASQWLARETRKVTPESLAMPFRSPFAEPEPVKAADGGFIAVGYEDGGEVDIGAGVLASKSGEKPRPEPFRIPPGQTEARLREFNRLDPATRSAIMEEDPRVQFGLRPAPASVSLPYTLSTMPGARALYDDTLRGTTTYGYVVPEARMLNPSTGRNVPTQDVVFLNPSRDAQAELKTRAHEAEHLLARRGLGKGVGINTKFDELIGDTGTRRRFVEAAVKMQPYLKKEYGLDSAYFDPKELAFQDRARVGHNLLYEQFAELAAIEQATGKDLTKDPELRKTIFKDKKVREVYNALTGLRQTRLDARDLSPYTPIPEKPDGMMEFIRSKLGFANGGDVGADSEEDILARAQAAAREGQAYRDMQEYLKARDAMPEIKAGSLPSQTAAEFQRTILPVGAGTIKINRGRLTDRTRETLPATLTHELAHAVDRQISQQAAEQAGIPNQFTEAYAKLVGPGEQRRADIARKLDPAWEKRNRSYRSSPRELAGHGMGAFVDNAAQTPGPGHVDATAATELAILMDLANRNADKKPKGLEKIPAFLRGIGYAEGGEAKSDAPTPEELERASKAAFGIVPSSGKGRKQSRVSDALQSGEAQLAAAKGLTMLPQNVVGAPVDIATLVARPFGYNVEKPVMGSEYLKEKTRAAGLAFKEPEDPTLRAFFTAGDISSNLINPAGATRTAVRGVEKTGQAAKELAEFAARPVERDPFLSGPMGAQRGAVRMPGTPDPTLAYLAGVPSAEKPFVGRLDQHVAGLSGTMQKEQFLNSLKGKFRDYDLARASEALADLGPTDKIKPVQILERLKTTYSPQSFRTIIHEPELGLFHQSTDNVYYDTNTVNNPPLGAISLSLDLSPQITQKQEGADKAANLLQNLFKRPSTPASADDVSFFDSYIKSSLGFSPERAEPLVAAVTEAQRVGENFRTMKAVRDDIKYPADAPGYGVQWSRRYNDFVAAGRDYDEAAKEASRLVKESLQKKAFERLKSFVPSERVAVWEKDFFSGNEAIKDMVINNMDLSLQAMSGHLDNLGSDVISSEIGKEALSAISAAQAYKGQHPALKAGNNPVGFSRFSEHTAQVPGLGEVPLMHFHELQSDLLQDVRRYGPAKGSKEADQKELADLKPRLAEAKQKLEQAEAERRAASARVELEGDKYAPLAKKAEARYQTAQGEYDRLYSREGILEDRIDRRGATYKLPQPFAGMEASPQVVQQLLVKNAVNAAIQRGKSGATFPGKESDQPQLYENLLYNLRQVAKDLGPGFEVRPVTLEGPNYTEFSHYGIFWGPEAAARIKKKGVPFKDGGMVERADDTRRYL